MNEQNKILQFFDQVCNTTIPFELVMEISKNKKYKIDTLTLKLTLENIDPKLKIINLSLNSTINKVYRIYKLLKNSDYDIINTHHTKSSLIIYLMYKIFYRKIFKDKIKWVHTVHNDYRFYKFYQKFIFNRIYMNADKIICNSNNTFNSLPKKYHSYQNIKVIYNGVNIERVNASGVKIKDKEKIIFSANRFVPQKNLISLINAFNNVHSQFPSWKLYLCGDGPLKPELIEYSRSLESSDCILFLGILPRESVYDFMKRSSVYVTPSLWEGFCNSNVEAMASGCALLSSNVGPLPEIAKDSAKYFTPTSLSDFENGLINILKNESARNELSERAIKRSTYFDIKIAANNYLDFYLK